MNKINKIWFIGHYSMPPEYEPRVKTLRMAHYFGLKGIDCTIFSASTIHNTDINLIEDNSLYIEKQYSDLKYVHIKCSNYSKSFIKRIVNMEQFAYRFSKVAKQFDMPDIAIIDTYCVAYRPIFRFCKTHNIQMILDVRDLWPQSIVEYLGYKENNPLIKALYLMEKDMYKTADKIIFSFAGGYEYIQDRKLDSIIPKSKVFYINNGVDLDEYLNNVKLYHIDDEDLCDKSKINIVYTGSVRRVNNLGLLLDVAKLIKNQNIRFLIWGSGDELEKLKKRVIDEAIHNVVFKGSVSKKYIPYITSMADINLIHNTPAQIFKYGLSFNKIFDYFAAGKPTITTFKCKYNPAIMEETGIEVESTDPQYIAKIIDVFVQKDRELYCINSKKAAVKYDYKMLSESLYNILLN